jgi:hypothetical protein
VLEAVPRHDLIALLDEDPDLAVGIPEAELPAARLRAVAPVIDVAPSTWDTEEVSASADGSWLGLIVLDGVLLRRVTVGSRAACELCARGDLLRPWDTDGQYDPLSVAVDWQVLTPTRLAVLNSGFAHRIARWPVLHSRIIGRATARARYLTLIQAVTHLPRVHTRLLLVFWVLAERNGTVGPRGVSVNLPVTHEVLASVVGALRPTVTLALQRLNRAGLLHRERSDRWLLTQRAVEILKRPGDFDLADIPGLDRALQG